MNCAPLGATGLDGLLLLIAAVLGVALIVGGAVLVRTRRGRTGFGAGAAVTLLVVATLSLGTLAPSPAVSADCPPPAETLPAGNSLTITQTSTITGMAPWVEPQPIFGTVTNNSDEETLITDIVVSISAVTLSPNAAPGTCTPDDYVLLNPRMPVDEMIAPRATVTFEGASIGFVDQPWNQDACKNATVHLLYVTP